MREIEGEEARAEMEKAKENEYISPNLHIRRCSTVDGTLIK